MWEAGAAAGEGEGPPELKGARKQGLPSQRQEARALPTPGLPPGGADGRRQSSGAVTQQVHEVGGDLLQQPLETNTRGEGNNQGGAQHCGTPWSPLYPTCP